MAYPKFVAELLALIDDVTDSDFQEIEKELGEVKATDKILGVASEPLRRLYITCSKKIKDGKNSIGVLNAKDLNTCNLGLTLTTLLEGTTQREFSSYNGNLLAMSLFGLNHVFENKLFVDFEFRKGWIVVIEDGADEKDESEIDESIDSLPNLTETLVDPEDGDDKDFERPSPTFQKTPFDPENGC